MKKIAFCLFVLAFSSCATEQNLCEEAQSKLDQCFPDDGINIGDSCDEERAASIVDESCNSLQAQSASAKDDGFCSGLLFWSDCHREFEMSVAMCDANENFCDWSDGLGTNDTICYAYEIRDQSGNTVVEDVASGSRFTVSHPLDDGEYDVVIKNRDGSDATFLVDGDNAESYNFLRTVDPALVTPSFTVQGGKVEQKEMILVVSGEESVKFRSCGNVNINMNLTCGDQPVVDGSLDWYATLTPLDGGGTVGEFNEAEPYFVIDGPNDQDITQFERTDNPQYLRHQSTFYQLAEGNYEVTFHRVELDASSRRQLEEIFFDFQGVERLPVLTDSKYATGETASHTFSFAHDEYTTEFGIVNREYTLAYDMCR